MSATTTDFFNAHYANPVEDADRQRATIEDNSMDINDVYPSNWLKANDLGGKKHTVTIETVELQEVGNGNKPVIIFKNREKGLVMNKTNAAVISSEYGPETQGWVGKEIVLYPAKVQFQGQTVNAIRVEIPVPAADPEFDDDVPF